MSDTITAPVHSDPHHAAQHMLHPNLALAFTSVGNAALAEDPDQAGELLRTAGTLVLAEGVRRAGIRETIASRYRSELTYGVWNAEVAGFYEFLTTVPDEKFRHLLIALWNLDANFDEPEDFAEEPVDPFAQLALRLDAVARELRGEEVEQAEQTLHQIQQDLAEEESAEGDAPAAADEKEEEAPKKRVRRPRRKKADTSERRVTVAALIKEQIVAAGDEIWEKGEKRFVEIEGLRRVEGGRVLIDVKGGDVFDLHPTNKVTVRVHNRAVSRETSEE